MPKVGKKTFPYTDKGEKEAKKMAKKTGEEVMPMKQKIMAQMKKKGAM